ncbi:MAG TPA: EamA family transporter [bacterium]|nr:EamA family transporter [bacterium]
MDWFFLAIFSYLLLAIVNLGDKFVVDKILKDSRVYAFMVGVLSAVIFIIALWFLYWPGLFLFLVNMIAGALFIFALWTMYEALRAGEASRVVVVIGSVIPVFTIILSLIFFKQNFTASQWLGIIFLLAGMVIMSLVVSRKRKWSIFIKRTLSVFSGGYSKKWIFFSILSAFIYSVFFIVTKYAYNHQEFLSSFIWIRLGGLLVALIFLIDKDSRKLILKNFKKSSLLKRVNIIKKKEPSKLFIIFNQGLGSIAFLLQNYAVYLGPVAIINALQGVQYAFLLILGIFLTIFFPKLLKEDISKKTLIKKVAAIILVGLGLYFIAR